MDMESFFSTWIYWLYYVIFINLINKGSNYRTQKKYGQIAFIFIFIFSFFRYGIGSDYNAYWGIVTDEREYTKVWEFLSGIIINTTKTLGFPPLCFILFGSITLFCYKYAIERLSVNQPLSWYFYFSFPLLFLQDCSTLRNAAAMGCFFVAYAMAFYNRKWKALVMALIAPLFHDMGYMALSVLFMPLIKKVDFKFNILFFVLSFMAGTIVANLVSAYLGNTGVGEHFMRYVEGENEGFKSFQYILYAISAVNFITYKKLVNDNERNKVFVTFVNMGMCLYNVFRVEPITAIRCCCFFLLFETLLIPSYRNIISRYFSSKMLANFICVTLFFMLQMTMVMKYVMSGNPCLAPYRIWLNNL